MKFFFVVLIGVIATALTIVFIKFYGSRSENSQDGVPTPATTQYPPSQFARYIDDIAGVDKSVIYDRDKSWLTQHDDLFKVHQTYSPGVVESESTTPHILHHQITAKNCVLSIASEDNRHLFQRCIYVDWNDNTVVIKHARLIHSFPLFGASPGGFVFKRNENPIASVGIVVPEVILPDQENPANRPDTIFIRKEADNGQLEEWFYDDFIKIPIQPFDTNLVVLMPTQPKVKLDSACVFWFRLSDDHKLEKASN